MGNSPVVAFKAGQDSPTEPGKLSCVSDPFPESVKWPELFPEMVDWLKTPIHPLVSQAVKTVEEKSLDDGWTEVKCILDGVQLDRYGFGKGDGTDRVHKFFKFQVNEEKREFRTITYKEECWLGEEEKTEMWVATTKFFEENPLRCEYYLVELTTGERHTADWAAGTLLGTLDPILQRMVNMKAKLLPDQESPDGTGKCVLSPPLDDLIKFDPLFDALVNLFKTKPPDGVQQFTVNDISDTEFETMIELMPAPGKESGAIVKQIFEVNKELGTINNTRTQLTPDGKEMKIKDFRKLHKEPELRFECYTIDGDGTKKTDRKAAQGDFLLQLNTAVYKGTSWFGW